MEEDKKNKNIVVYWSGGKDSTAQILKMIELGYRGFDVVCIDTQLEFDEMYVYWEKCINYFKQFDIKVHTYKSQYTRDEYFYKVKMKGNRKGEIYGFPFTIGPWCNDRLKLEAIRKAEQDFKGYINFIGFAIDEKSKLRQLRIKNKLNGINKFTTQKWITDKKTGEKKQITIEHDITNERYLLCEYKMTEQDCLNLTIKYDLYNPLYDYFDRTGCWCCPKQPKKSLKQIYLHFPNKWEQLRIWQRDSPRPFRPNESIFDIEEQFKKEPIISGSLI